MKDKVKTKPKTILARKKAEAEKECRKILDKSNAEIAVLDILPDCLRITDVGGFSDNFLVESYVDCSEEGFVFELKNFIKKLPPVAVYDIKQNQLRWIRRRSAEVPDNAEVNPICSVHIYHTSCNSEFFVCWYASVEGKILNVYIQLKNPGKLFKYSEEQRTSKGIWKVFNTKFKGFEVRHHRPRATTFYWKEGTPVMDIFDFDKEFHEHKYLVCL